jgi:hypothetical protein
MSGNAKPGTHTNIIQDLTRNNQSLLGWTQYFTICLALVLQSGLNLGVENELHLLWFLVVVL